MGELEDATENQNSEQKLLKIAPFTDQNLVDFAKSIDFQVYDSQTTKLMKNIENLDDLAFIFEADRNFLLRRYVENLLRINSEDVKKQQEDSEFREKRERDGLFGAVKFLNEKLKKSLFYLPG